MVEIETIVKRASKACGFSWGGSEEIGKHIRLLEMFGIHGIKNLNSYFNKFKDKKFQNINLIAKTNLSPAARTAYNKAQKFYKSIEFHSLLDIYNKLKIELDIEHLDNIFNNSESFVKCFYSNITI